MFGVILTRGSVLNDQAQGKMRQMWYSHILCPSLSPPLQPSGKGPRLPEVYCVISRLGCFGLFSKVRDAIFLPIPVTALIVVSADSLEKHLCERKGVQNKYR